MKFPYYPPCHGTMQVREIRLHGQLMEYGESRTREVTAPGPRGLMGGHLVLHEDLLELLNLMDLHFVVLLAHIAPVLSRREPQLEADSALHGASMTSGLQLEPGIQPGGGYLSEWNVNRAEEVVL